MSKVKKRMSKKELIKYRIEHPKTSILKNPRLRKIRKNLRDIIIYAINEEIDRLIALRVLYIKKREESGLILPSRFKREVALQHKLMGLRSALRKSICLCYNSAGCVSGGQQVGGKEYNTNVNMIWDPKYERWICDWCFYLQYPSSPISKKNKKNIDPSVFHVPKLSAIEFHKSQRKLEKLSIFSQIQPNSTKTKKVSKDIFKIIEKEINSTKDKNNR